MKEHAQSRANNICNRKNMSKNTNEEAMTRLQASIDAIDKRMRIDSNDLDYETHLRQKRQLQQILDRMKSRHE